MALYEWQHLRSLSFLSLSGFILMLRVSVAILAQAFLQQGFQQVLPLQALTRSQRPR